MSIANEMDLLGQCNIFVEPRHGVNHCRHTVTWVTPEPVRLIRNSDEYSVHTPQFQCAEELVALRDRRPPVFLTRDNHRRRPEILRVKQRRMLDVIVWILPRHPLSID